MWMEQKYLNCFQFSFFTVVTQNHVWFQVGYAVGGTSSNFFREPQSEELKLLAEQELLKLQKTLEAFRCKRLNVLVSTSVLEEGIDITQCNLVIRFDRIQEFRSYVQSKGMVIWVMGY